MENLKRYEILEELARLSGYKELEYDIELKDGRIVKLKNIKIKEIEVK